MERSGMSKLRYIDKITVDNKKAVIKYNHEFFEYVVQFNPYGKGLKYNSSQNKEKLEKFFDSIESEEDL